jgi:hypothetical protein
MIATVLEIRPYRRGWKVFEAPGVEPIFLTGDQAINYARNRASFRSGEIQIRDLFGNILRTTRAAVRGHAAGTESDF